MLLSLSFTKVIAEMPAMAPLFVDNKQNQPMWEAIPYPVDSNVMSYFSPNNSLFQPGSLPMGQGMPIWNAPNYLVDPSASFYSMPYYPPPSFLNAYPSAAATGQQMLTGMTDAINLGVMPNAVPFNTISSPSIPQALPANQFPPLDLSVSPKSTVQDVDNNPQMYMAAPYYMMPMAPPEAPAVSTQPLRSHDLNPNRVAEVTAKKDAKLIKVLQQSISDNITIMGNVFEGKKLLVERITKLENEIKQQQQQLTQLDTKNEATIKEKNRLLNKAKATLQNNISIMQRFLRSSDQKENERVELQDQLTQQQQLCSTTTNTNQALIETKNTLLGKAKNTITDNIEVMQHFTKQHESLTANVANLNSQINTQTEQNNTLEAKYQNKIQAFAGLSQQLSGATADDDNDNVVNPSDKCPNTPEGTYVDVSGCPADVDADGITDDIDKCAFTRPGFITNSKGCEIDSDKDGVVDSKDQCPATIEKTKVSATGCEVDDDNDDVPNSKDQCPNTAVGSVVNDKGCEVDTDMDSIIDSKDQCPNTAEGIKVDTKGCEIDSDADGIVDSKDQCTNTLNGINVDPKGCEIDSDGDGITDSKDQCPATTTGIKVDKTGCITDSDNDGVIDSEDACLHSVEGAKVDDKGCEPDTDKDGITDSKDQCPMTAENINVNEKGCELDSDKDGIVDSKDLCIDTGTGLTVNEKGCELDSDQDGILDRLDKCPNTVLGATIDNVTGCEPDSDKDGIADNKDLCPSTPSSTKVNGVGCSADEKITLKGVNFKSASAQLTSDSLPILDESAAVLKRHPDIHIEVGGHTDSAGSAVMNKSLSQKRATSVMSYLISKGINSSKITAKGYGEEAPIADNKTDTGRATNRRVELKITHE
jgi:outer membrane protein OmpA-like peptidoglycan-associated protein